MHFQDFAEDGAGINRRKLERVTENEEACAFGDGFEKCGEHFDVDHARFVNDEDGILGELLFVIVHEATFAFGESEQTVDGTAFEFVQLAENALVVGLLFIADSGEAVDKAFAHAVGGFAARGGEIDVPIEHFAVACKQVPQNVENDGGLAGARAAGDNEVFGLPADYGFGLALLDEEGLVAEWLTDACDFFGALRDFFIGRFAAVLEQNFCRFFNHAFGIEMLSEIEVRSVRALGENERLAQRVFGGSRVGFSAFHNGRKVTCQEVLNAVRDNACKIVCGCKCTFVDIFFGGADAEHHETVPFAGPHIRELICIQRNTCVAVVEERHA